MSYDGTIKIDTSLDNRGFKDGLNSLKSLATTGFIAIGAAAAAGLGAVVKKGTDFEAQMSRVKAISGATGEEFEKLKEQAKELGALTAFSASEAAQGMENLASAGFDTTEIMAAMPGMLDLAASSGTDLATSADIAAATLRGFGLAASEAGHVADVLAKNAAQTNAAVVDTGMAMKYIAPVAQNAGWSLESVTAAIGAMADAGIKGEQAGTTLRGALVQLMNPSKESADAMDAIGFSAYDASGKMKPLSEIIADVSKSTANMTAQQRDATIATIFGTNALSGMQILLGAGSEELDKMTASLISSTGAAEEMAKVMMDNLKGQLEELGGAAETLGLTVYEGIEQPLKTAVAAGVEALNNFTRSLKDGEMQTALKNIGQLLGELVRLGTELATVVLPPLTKLLGWLGERSKTVTVVLLGTIAAVKGYGLAVTTLNGILAAYKAAGLAATAVTVSLNAAMSAGIFGAVALAVIGLINALDEFHHASSRANHQVRLLIESNQDLKESYEDLKVAAEETETAELAKIETVKQLIPRLEELSKKTKLTADEDGELNSIIEQLNSAMPELQLAIDNETGALNRQINTVWEAVSAYQSLAKAKAAQSLLEEAERGKLETQKALSDNLKIAEIVIDAQRKAYETGRILNDFLPDDLKDTSLRDLNQIDEELRSNLKSYEEDSAYYSNIITENSTQFQKFKKQIVDTDKEISASSQKNTAAYSSASKSKIKTAKEESEKLTGIHEDDFRNLKYLRDTDQISQAQYYDTLGKLRDAYFEEGSEDWQRYSTEIYNYNKSVLEQQVKDIEAAYSELAKFSDESLSDIIKKQETMSSKLASFGELYSLETLTLKGPGGRDIEITRAMLGDLQKTNDLLKEYSYLLQEIKNRDNVPSEFAALLADLPVEEGLYFMRTLNSAPESEFNRYINTWTENQKLSKAIAGEYYRDEVKGAIDSIYEKAREAGIELPEGFFDTGTNSAKNFGQAFIEELNRQMEEIRRKVADFNASLIPQYSFGGGGISAQTVNNSATYIFNSSGETVSQQLQSARAHNEVERMRGL